jgi:hypothetical protein
VHDFRTENHKLKQKIAELEARTAYLENEALQYRTHELLATGMRGETLVSKIVNGRVTAYAIGHDIETGGGTLLEVKRSKLHSWDKRSGSTKWQWAKLLGESGKKKYDYAILVGDIDRRYAEYYKDPNSSWVIFCVPFEEINEVATQGQRADYRHIQISTNPMGTRRMKTKKLFQEYQISTCELGERFGL